MDSDDNSAGTARRGSLSSFKGKPGALKDCAWLWVGGGSFFKAWRKTNVFRTRAGEWIAPALGAGGRMHAEG